MDWTAGHCEDISLNTYGVFPSFLPRHPYTILGCGILVAGVPAFSMALLLSSPQALTTFAMPVILHFEPLCCETVVTAGQVWRCRLPGCTGGQAFPPHMQRHYTPAMPHALPAHFLHKHCIASCARFLRLTILSTSILLGDSLHFSETVKKKASPATMPLPLFSRAWRGHEHYLSGRQV